MVYKLRKRYFATEYYVLFFFTFLEFRLYSNSDGRNTLSTQATTGNWILQFFLGLKGGKHFIALSWELAEEMLRQMAEVFLEYVMLHLNAWDGTKSS